jgi:hypothetical protein
MKVYKYRSDEYLERDLSSLLQNSIYTAPFITLNDPNEGICNEIISDVCNLIESIFHGDTKRVRVQLDKLLSFKDSVGIYSMSKTPLDSHMWVNYAGNERGFCIEYDLEKLCEQTESRPNWDINVLEVDYVKRFPTITIDDIKDSAILRKLFGTKLKKWKQEQEIRIVKDQYGCKTYHPSALKAIYFGEKCNDSLQSQIITALQGRDVKFYKIFKFGQLLSANLVCENKRDVQRLNRSEFEVITRHAPIVENFIIIYKPNSWTKQDISEFMDIFKVEYTTKQANLWIYDNAVNRSLLDKEPITLSDKEYNEIESHKIAESLFSGKIDFEKYYNL